MRHSVVLDLKKCRGCTTCIKNCPTEAIRVRNGKATILPNRCIDCGDLHPRVPPQRGEVAFATRLDQLKNFKYTVAIPDPALYGQFQNLNDVDIVLDGLLALGFDQVFEAAAASEMLGGHRPQPHPARADSGPCPRSLPPARRWCGSSPFASPSSSATSPRLFPPRSWPPFWPGRTR